MLITGVLLTGIKFSLPPLVWGTILGALSLAAFMDWGRRTLREWAHDTRLRRAQCHESELSRQTTPIAGVTTLPMSSMRRSIRQGP
jgi:hypothetical protein